MTNANWSKPSGYRAVGVLDIGSSKTVCLIGVIGGWSKSHGAGASPLRVVGLAQQKSHGVTSGIVTDLDQAEQVTRATVAQAEAMAGVTLDDIVVSVSGGSLLSQNFRTKVDVTGGFVRHDDLARLHKAGHSYAHHDGRSIIHLAHQGYRVDGVERVEDPSGMAGRHVSADWHAASADDAALNNMLLMIERCYLRASHMFVASYASGLATTTEEERRLGVTCIDLGGGTTTLSVFNDGAFVFQDALAMGANHITLDIARGLHTPLAEAERIKALYGSVICAHSDQHETFSYPLLGGEDGEMQQATKAQLSGLVRRRFDELIARINERLAKARVGPYAGDQIVITGGGSALAGADTYLSHALQKRVRVAGPSGVSGLPPMMTGPSFATAVGLLVAKSREFNRAVGARHPKIPASSRYWGRVGAWLKQGF